jgi:hypothetical protein
MASLGFGSPAHAALYSPALQRQVALLTVDKMADYFLFDEMDRPIRFAIKEQMVKMGFRVIRGHALSSSPPQRHQKYSGTCCQNYGPEAWAEPSTDRCPV